MAIKEKRRTVPHRLLCILLLMVIVSLHTHVEASLLLPSTVMGDVTIELSLDDGSSAVNAGGDLEPLEASEAAVIQIQTLYRVCQSRPQRTLNSQSNRLMRTRTAQQLAQTTPSTYRAHSEHHYITFYCISKPADYYVFTLQRLLC